MIQIFNKKKHWEEPRNAERGETNFIIFKNFNITLKNPLIILKVTQKILLYSMKNKYANSIATKPNSQFKRCQQRFASFDKSNNIGNNGSKKISIKL